MYVYYEVVATQALVSVQPPQARLAAGNLVTEDWLHLLLVLFASFFFSFWGRGEGLKTYPCHDHRKQIGLEALHAYLYSM